MKIDKKKRGVKIQYRLIFTGLSLLLQAVFLYIASTELQHYSLVLYTIFEFVAIITVIYIVNKRGNPSYKIAWIVFILLLPVFGLFVYMLWGGGRTFPHQKKRMKYWENYYAKYISQDEEVAELIRYEASVLSRQAGYLTKESGFPVYTHSSVEYLSPGEVFFPRFLDELRQAKHYIFMEYFIIADGKMWAAVRKILIEKAKAGVEVKILFDDFGSIRRQYKGFVSYLRKHGIEVAIFNPVKPSFNVFMNNRNHRKITIIDGQVAFTGGINLADEYINRVQPYGQWMDCAVLIRGKAVDSFLVMFATMWSFNTEQPIPMSKHLLSEPTESRHYVIPYCDGPVSSHFPAEGIYMQILNTAHRYVWLATPYLILDNSMTTVLKLAAQSGVDVRILTPFTPDKGYVHPVTQYHYTELLEAGVRIYEYTPGFIHSKVFLSDDTVATCGTVNMDFRSFVFHFECGAWFTDETAIGEMKGQFLQLFRDSREIRLALWKKRPIIEKIKQWCLHLFAPFM